jgi:beta-galactosidase
MHAGLLRPDRIDDVGAHEARQAAADVGLIGDAGIVRGSVALVFDYQSDWVTKIQPQGRGFSALRLAFEFYTALRQQGFDVDILPPSAPLEGYALVVVPCLPILPDGFVAKIAGLDVPILFGPRTGSKTSDFAIPEALPPGGLQELLPIKVTRVESLRPGASELGEGFAISHWLEHVESEVAAEELLLNGQGVVWRHGNLSYLAAWPDAALLRRLVGRMAAQAGLETLDLPDGLRMRRAGPYRFAFNYGSIAVDLPTDHGKAYVFGGTPLPPAGVAVWRVR